MGEDTHCQVIQGEPSKKGRKAKGPDFGNLIDAAVVGLFGLAAVCTGHEHWLKTHEEVCSITAPLNAWADELPVKTRKEIEKRIAPIMVAIGCATVIGPDMVIEMRLRQGWRIDASTGYLVPPSAFRTEGYNVSPQGQAAAPNAGVHAGPSANGRQTGNHGERLAPIPPGIVGFDI